MTAMPVANDAHEAGEQESASICLQLSHDIPEDGPRPALHLRHHAMFSSRE